MGKLKVICCCTVILGLLITLTGCWDREEIEKKAYVIAIGMEKGQGKDRIKISYLIENPEFGSQQQGGGIQEPPAEIISFETNDLISAKSLANTVIAKTISYDLLTTVFVSEELAKDENLIRWMYDAEKGMEIRRDANFLVTKEPVSEYLVKNHPKLDTRPHKYIELIINSAADSGLITKSELELYFRIAEADADLFLAGYTSVEKSNEPRPTNDEDQLKAGQFYFEGETNNTNFIGTAVFKEGKMIDTLTGEETRMAILLNNSIKAPFIITTYPDPFDEKYRIAARVVKNRNNKVKMDFTHGTPKIDVTVPITFEILTDHSMTNYATDSDKRKKLKKYLEERLNNRFNDFVKKTQEEYGTEPFGWSLPARKEFATIKEWETFDWMKTYPDMKINVHVNIRLSKFGRQSKLPSIKETRD